MKFSNTLATLAATLALSEAADTTTTSYTGPTATFADGFSSLTGTYGISLLTVSSVESSSTTSTAQNNKKRQETYVNTVTETAPAVTYTVNAGTYTVNAGTSTFIASATTTVGGVAETTTSSDTESATSSSTSSTETSSTSTESQSSSSSSSSPSSSSSSSSDSTKQANIPSVCSSSEGAVLVTLKDGILTDSAGRIGSIVANQQLQFDGPPPQAGYIYASGWSVDDTGLLYLGDDKEFYQCLSGSFYNLYNENVDPAACSLVNIQFVQLTSC
ncbi:unnamed protein product [Ambrosiozyma monospora]|uniref:Unnamed protein product n=1 Tax=Ambrosiozyma monospora TaxID=43982 RepID=A0A9W7DCT5_AMBMO|nr:unnamed protein product [Ambrosiozyma monospora]